MSGAVGTPISQAPDAGAFDPTWRIPVSVLGSDQAFSTTADKLQRGGTFVPTAGGPLLGGLMLNDNQATSDGGALRANRNISWTPRSLDLSNHPVQLYHTFTGTMLDPPTSPFAYGGIDIRNIYNGFNTGMLGMRPFQSWTQIGPGTVGQTFSAFIGQVSQVAPHPPGTNVWTRNTQFPLGYGITNDLSHYEVISAGRSANAGNGPTGYSQGIVDGTVVWAYMGPGVPRRWASGIEYFRGELVINANNGGLFRVEQQGIAGAFPGPQRYRGPWPDVSLASAGEDITLDGEQTVDGNLATLGMRVLAKDQADLTENGIYNVGTPWTRSHEASIFPYLPNGYTTVDAGATNAGLTFQCSTDRAGSFGSTAITFTQITKPDTTAIPDGSVVWSQKGVGSQAHGYVGSGLNSTASFNMGGRGINETVGHQWGAVIGTTMTANATYGSESIALELDDRVTGSVRKAVALQIVRQGLQGLKSDVAFIINAQGGPQKYKTAMQLANATDPNGYAFLFQPFGAAGRQHMAGALDMKMVVPDGAGDFGGGFLVRGPTGYYDQFGAWQLRFASITPTATGLMIDITNVELQSITIMPGQGGANWSPGDNFKGDDGCWGAVLTTDPAGQMLTGRIIGASQVPAPGPASIILTPFNPESSFDSLGGDPIPENVGPTGDVIWADPATAIPTYAGAINPTLYLGTNNAVAINVGNALSNLFINGQISAPLLLNAANDSVAAGAGIRVGQWYRNGSVLMQRAA